LWLERPRELLGEAPSYLAYCRGFHYYLAEIYLPLYQARAYLAINDETRARNAIWTALRNLEGDKLYLPFAENYSSLWTVLDPLLTDEAPEVRDGVRKLANSFQSGVDKIRRSLNKEKAPFGFTWRESEVALMAADGLTYHEIAERLSISENTVKAHLKAAYRKTGAGSRAQLREIFRDLKVILKLRENDK
jgi:LuxR family maltose regulon positive regulatory protein